MRLDRDPVALAAAEVSLRGLAVKLAHSDFCELPEVMGEIGIEHVDGIVLDLGLSSDQLADESRGFSFESPGPLDLRFDPASGEPAARLVNRMAERQLADLIYRYGEDAIADGLRGQLSSAAMSAKLSRPRNWLKSVSPRHSARPAPCRRLTRPPAPSRRCVLR